MPPKCLILIPPSEGKTPEGEGPPLGKTTKPVKEMVDRLRKYNGDWGKLLGVKGNALESGIEANRSILKSPTMPAIERYTGVVYQGIDYGTLSKKGSIFFDRHIRIVSAVFGLVEPERLIPDYKLKIEKLDADKYWKPILSEQIGSTYVIDLLPNAHKKAVGYESGIEVDFVVEKKGKRVSAGHFGKLIKGRFVRWLCANGVTDPKDFKKFKEDGYAWTGEVFLKQE